MFHPSGWRRPLAAHLTIDESAATAMSQVDPVEERRGFWAAGTAVFVLWNLSTLVGALAGNALGDPKTWGLDSAAVAAFVGLLWPRLTAREPIAVALVCGVVTALTVRVLPAGIPILVAAAVAAGLGLSRKPARRSSGTDETGKES